MARAKGKSSTKPKTVLKSSSKKSVKAMTLAAGRVARSPVLDLGPPRARHSPIDVMSIKSGAPRVPKRKPMLPSVAAFKPGWRQKVDRMKQLQAELDEEEDDSYEQLMKSNDDDASELESDEEEDDDEEDWEAELTLIGADLNEPEETDQSRNEALIEALKIPFAALSVQMKNEMLAELTPTTNKIKDANKEISVANTNLKTQLSAFRDEADGIQGDAEDRASELKDIMTESQATLKRLLKELEAAYTMREEVRDVLRQCFDDSRAAMIEHLDALAVGHHGEAEIFEAKAKKIAKRAKNATVQWERMMTMK